MRVRKLAILIAMCTECFNWRRQSGWIAT